MATEEKTNQDKLPEFLSKRIDQFQKLEALVDIIMKVASATQLGDAYRTLIDRVEDAWKETDKVNKDNAKKIKRDRSLMQDARWGWFNSVHTALLKAHSHNNPRRDCRDLNKVQAAAGLIGHELSFCRYNLEEALKTAGT